MTSALTAEQMAQEVLSKVDGVQKHLHDEMEASTGKIREDFQKRMAAVEARAQKAEETLAEIKRTSMPGVELMPVDKLLSDRETKNFYSIGRLSKLVAHSALKRFGRDPSGIIDISDCGPELEVSRQLGESAVNKAQQHVGTAEAGGVLVPREVSNQIIMDLKPQSVAMRAGIQTITGVTGTLSIPKKVNAITGETLNTELPGSLTPQVVTFTDINLDGRPFGAAVDLSFKAFRQTAPALEGIMRQDISEQLGLQVDQHVFKGTGQGGQPLGIINSGTGLNSKAWTGAQFGSAALTGGLGDYDTSLALLRGMMHEIRIDNALGDNMAFVCEPAALLKFETALTLAGTPMYLGLQDTEFQRIIGYPIYNSTNLNNAATSDAFFMLGRFSQVIHPVWGGIEFAVTDSDGSKFLQGVVTIRAIGQHDVAVRHPQAFCKATSFNAS